MFSLLKACRAKRKYYRSLSIKLISLFFDRDYRNWILLGIGAIIGTGIFILNGTGALTAGPALTISFVIAAVACAFSALAYAEFASTIPVAGSIYTYAYATLGEIIVWIIRWDLMIEYGLASSAVSVGWSGYFQSLLAGFGIKIPTVLSAAPGAIPGVSTWLNLPAFLIMMVLTYILFLGARTSAKINNIMVIVKVSVVLLFIIVGSFYIKPANRQPFMPMCWSGVFNAAAVVFTANFLTPKSDFKVDLKRI
ncbi:hypothetical protein ACTFIZ_008604 [Dictyostelium cf. discoideum]